MRDAILALSVHWDGSTCRLVGRTSEYTPAPRPTSTRSIRPRRRRYRLAFRTITTGDLRNRLDQGTNFEFSNVLTDKWFARSFNRSQRPNATKPGGSRARGPPSVSLLAPIG
jgi:hypothetical protein